MADVTPEQPRSGQWSPQQRFWGISKYHQTRSYKKIEAEFLQKCSCEKYTDKKRIEAWVKNFELFGIVKNLNKKSDRQGSHSGRKRVRYEAIIDRIRDYVKTPQNGASERGRNLLKHTP